MLIFKIWIARNLQLYQNKTSAPQKLSEEALVGVLQFNRWNPELRVSRKIRVQPVFELINRLSQEVIQPEYQSKKKEKIIKETNVKYRQNVSINPITVTWYQ